MVLKVFNKFGKIAKLEFMWHKSGLRRGQPRGCCFIEYSTSEVRTVWLVLACAATNCRHHRYRACAPPQDAAAAKAGVHGKRMLGRPVIVRFVDERVVSTTGPQGKRDAATMAAAAAAAAAAAPATGTTMSHDKLEAVYESKIQELSKHLDVLVRDSVTCFSCNCIQACVLPPSPCRNAKRNESQH